MILKEEPIDSNLGYNEESFETNSNLEENSANEAKTNFEANDESWLQYMKPVENNLKSNKEGTVDLNDVEVVTSDQNIYYEL